MDSVKLRKYNLMVVRSSPTANILDALVLMYKMFVKQRKNFENYAEVHEKNDPSC